MLVTGGHVITRKSPESFQSRNTGCVWWCIIYLFIHSFNYLFLFKLTLKNYERQLYLKYAQYYISELTHNSMSFNEIAGFTEWRVRWSNSTLTHVCAYCLNTHGHWKCNRFYFYFFSSVICVTDFLPLHAKITSPRCKLVWWRTFMTILFLKKYAILTRRNSRQRMWRCHVLPLCEKTRCLLVHFFFFFL